MRNEIFGGDTDLIAFPYLFKTSKSTVGECCSSFNFFLTSTSWQQTVSASFPFNLMLFFCDFEPNVITLVLLILTSNPYSVVAFVNMSRRSWSFILFFLIRLMSSSMVCQCKYVSGANFYVLCIACSRYIHCVKYSNFT